jgi:hypothetical protein
MELTSAGKFLAEKCVASLLRPDCRLVHLSYIYRYFVSQHVRA